MKSSLKNMTVVLFTITLLVSAAVGGVNIITADPIAQAEERAKEEALKLVLPPFDKTSNQTLTIDQLPITVYTATAGDKLVGYAVETATKKGFGGEIDMMVGFNPAGEVINVNVLQQAETPGLGTKMTDKENVLLSSIQGKNLEKMKLVDGKLAVTKDGGDVDALTAATISSRAYVDAINRAWMAYRSVVSGEAPTDVASGASNPSAESATASPAATEGTSGASQTTAQPTAQENKSADGASGASQTTAQPATQENKSADGASGASNTAGSDSTAKPAAEKGGQK